MLSEQSCPVCQCFVNLKLLYPKIEIKSQQGIKDSDGDWDNKSQPTQVSANSAQAICPVWKIPHYTLQFVIKMLSEMFPDQKTILAKY